MAARKKSQSPDDHPRAAAAAAALIRDKRVIRGTDGWPGAELGAAQEPGFRSRACELDRAGARSFVSRPRIALGLSPDKSRDLRPSQE